MAAWVILIGLGVAVVGVLVKVGVDIARFLRADREAHGGRQTADAARKAGAVIVLVVVLVALLIVVPLLVGDA